MKKLLSLLIIATIITSSLCVSYFAIDDNSTQNNTTEGTTVPVTETSSTVVTTEPVTESSTVESSTVPTTTKPIVKPVVKVKRIKLNKSIVNLAKKGKTCIVKATVYPTNAKNKKVSWKASNKNITVNQNGKVTAKKLGTSKIKVTAKDGSKKSATVLVVVGKKVKKITLNKTSVTLNNNRTYKLKKSISNKNAVYKAVQWKSTNTKIATVNSNGVVKGLKRGSCYVVATAKDGSKKSAKCKVTVRQLVTKLSYNKKTQKTSVDVGKTIKFNVVVSPSNANNKGLVFSTGNKKVATVNSKGIIKGLNSGKVVITAKAKDGSKKVVKVSIKVNPKPITMNTKLTHKQFVSNKEYVDMYCKALNDYFESCGAVINPNMVGGSQWCVNDTTMFDNNISIKDFMVGTVNIWTCRMAKDAVNNNGSWKDLKKGNSLSDFLEEMEKYGNYVIPTYNPNKVLNSDWNGWKDYCKHNTSDDILNIYVCPSKINTSAGTEYVIYMYHETNASLKIKGIPLVKE